MRAASRSATRDTAGTARTWIETPHAVRTRELLAGMCVSAASAARVEALASSLYEAGYVVPPDLAVVIAGAVHTGQILMLRGTPGCGKTYLAECLSRVFNPDLPLLRIEGHEEVSVESLLYSQDDVGLRLFLEASTRARSTEVADLLALCEEARSRFVHFGPIVQSVLHGAEHGRRRVLLVDELDKFRGQSEALLLSFLNDYTVALPHLGLFFAPEPGLEPIVVVTANESREIQAPTQRRCVVVPVTTPTILDEDEILSIAVPELPARARHFVLLLALRIRSESLGLTKPLSISEVIDFARAVAHFEPDRMTPEFVEAHVPFLAKNGRDQYLLGLKVRPSFAWVERQLALTGGDLRASADLLVELDRRQLESRRKRDGDLRL